MLRDILEKDVPLKSWFAPETKNFLTGLFQHDPTKRLGQFLPGSQDDADDIRQHEYFKDINWSHVKNKSHMAPFIPNVRDMVDTSAIDKIFTDETPEETFVDPGIMNKELSQY